MKSVMIDGVPYAPATSGTARFGVAISTHRRRQILAQTLPKVLDSLPPETPVVLTCDDQATYRDAVEDWAGRVDAILQTPPGVYASKNAGLEWLMTRRPKVEHLFLLDDDVHPAPRVDPWTPYIDAPEPHYAHSWGLPVVHRDKTVVATTRSGGVVLYATRTLVEQIGGMSGEFGTWGHEHWNWSDRAHNQGLTSNRYQDLPAAFDGDLWVEYDRPEHRPPKFEGVKTAAQVAENKAKWPEWERLRGSDTRFVEYRRETPLKHVVAAYYRAADPQTGKPFPNYGRDALRPLTSTVAGAPWRVHVLSNAVDALTHPGKGGGKPLPANVEFHAVDLTDGMPTDWQRWFHLRQFLTELRRELGGLRGVEVWHVDATDVQLVNPPQIDAGRLYCGWEPTTVACKWVARQIQGMPDALAAQFQGLEDQTLLNPGVLGGDAEQLARFVNVMCSQLAEAAYWGRPTQIRDNLVFQLAAARWEREGNPPIVSGPRVATVFKSEGRLGGELAWWQHK